MRKQVLLAKVFFYEMVTLQTKVVWTTVSKMQYGQIWATNISDTDIEFLYFGNKHTLSLCKKGNKRTCKSEMSGKCKS